MCVKTPVLCVSVTVTMCVKTPVLCVSVTVTMCVKTPVLCAGLGQCTENAECSSPSGGLCVCDNGFYKDGDLCLKKRGEGQPCDKTEQCVANAKCSPGQCHWTFLTPGVAQVSVTGRF